MTTPRWNLHDGSLNLDGEPVLLLGGQVHNSTSSHPDAIDDAFAKAHLLGANTVLAPVCWDLVEPSEGTFDFDLVDHLLRTADQHGLRLVPLWFGAFKNAGSTYSPTWVRADRSRFPRAVTHDTARPAFTYEGATAKPVLSVFSPELVDADAVAFEALMAFIAAHPLRDLVPLVQVENEVGLLADSRDRSAIAQKAWDAAVPPSLLHALPRLAPESMAGTAWRDHGTKSAGSWAEVLGDDWRAHEVFMAWGFASYVDRVAARGQRAWPVPMYANAWLGPQPGQDRPGLYPSGGPSSRVLDVWRAIAPRLSMRSPDIYVDDAAGAAATYSADGATLFVPECRPRAGDAVIALAAGSIGWSAFGVEDVRAGSQVSQLLHALAPIEAELAHARAEGRLLGATLDGGEEQRLLLGNLQLTLRGTGFLFRSMLLDAGVSIPEPAPGEAETESDATIVGPHDGRAFGLVLVESPSQFLVIGQGLTVDFASERGPVEIDRVVELRDTGGTWTEGRSLNGDERLRVLPIDRVGVARIRILRSE